MAALGFWLETPEIPGRLLARLALVLPFLAAGVQMLRPGRCMLLSSWTAFSTVA